MFSFHLAAMSSAAPFDRAVALACTMHTMRARFIYVRCGCLASTLWPVRLMLERNGSVRTRTLADVLVLLRCTICSARPLSVHLTENGYPPDVRGDLEPGWNVLLHGTEAGMGAIKAPHTTRLPDADNVG